MIKPFVSLASLLLLMVLTMVLHSIFFSHKKTSLSMKTLSSLTHMTALSLSIAYDETPHNTTYPDMPSLKRMDFIYDK